MGPEKRLLTAVMLIEAVDTASLPQPPISFITDLIRGMESLAVFFVNGLGFLIELFKTLWHFAMWILDCLSYVPGFLTKIVLFLSEAAGATVDAVVGTIKGIAAAPGNVANAGGNFLLFLGKSLFWAAWAAAAVVTAAVIWQICRFYFGNKKTYKVKIEDATHDLFSSIEKNPNDSKLLTNKFESTMKQLITSKSGRGSLSKSENDLMHNIMSSVQETPKHVLLARLKPEPESLATITAKEIERVHV